MEKMAKTDSGKVIVYVVLVTTSPDPAPEDRSSQLIYGGTQLLDAYHTINDYPKQKEKELKAGGSTQFEVITMAGTEILKTEIFIEDIMGKQSPFDKTV